MSDRTIPRDDQLEPVQFAEVNVTLATPAGTPGRSLPAFEYKYQGQRYIASRWRLTDEQLKEVTSSRSIWMHTVGSQPPVALSIKRPWSMEAKSQ
jgi:hypothetical protein